MFKKFTMGILLALSAAIGGLAFVFSAQAHFQPTPCDFITSGGFVFTDSGAKANFGAHGGCKNGEFWGHINFVDHGTGLHVNSTEITGYLVDPPVPNARDICGIAKTNGPTETVRFRVRLVDNGEPGRDDMFGIRLSDGYHLSTRSLADEEPGGGNVQLHKPNPSTTGPTPPLSEHEMCGDLTFP